MLVSTKVQFNPSNSTSVTVLHSSEGTVHIGNTEVYNKSISRYERSAGFINIAIAKSVMDSFLNDYQTFYYQSLDSNILCKRNSETSIIV